MKKKIFYIYTKQTFNAKDIQYSGKWYKPDKVISYRAEVTNFEHLILASDLEEAIAKYKDRYNWNHTDKCISVWFDFSLCGYPKICKDANFECEVVGYETHKFSFNELKDKLRSEEFVEYCRQELYPIEVVMKESEHISE